MSVKLSSGWEMPLLGFGLFKLESEACEAIIRKALAVGYRHFDGAAIYLNEAAVGAALKTSNVPRSELFLTSKLWCTMQHPKLVPKAIEKTLKDLDTDYLDLYLVHWPLAFEAKEEGSVEYDGEGQTRYDSEGRAVLRKDVSLVDTWRAMERLVDEGRVRTIGVSNFTIPKLQVILDNCRIPPAVNQVECHPYLQQEKLLQFCRQKGIHVTAYAPLGAQKEPRVLEDATVRSIGEKYGMTPAQVCLKWGLQGAACSVIPKTAQLGRVEENWQAQSFPDFAASDLQALSKLDRKHRFFNPLNYWKVDCFDDDPL